MNTKFPIKKKDYMNALSQKKKKKNVINTSDKKKQHC